MTDKIEIALKEKHQNTFFTEKDRHDIEIHVVGYTILGYYEYGDVYYEVKDIDGQVVESDSNYIKEYIKESFEDRIKE